MFLLKGLALITVTVAALKWVMVWIFTFMLTHMFGITGAFGAEPSRSNVGKQIEVPQQASAAMKDAKVKVIVVLNFDCPIAANYINPLSAMASKNKSHGVAFVGVYPGDDTDAELARNVREYKPGFPIVRDQRHAIVKALAATTTPEVFVLDSKRVLRYRGRIDDQYTEERKKNAKVTRYDLRDAIDAVLAGKPIAEPATPPFGCPIPPFVATEDTSAKITYHRDVLPILQGRCQDCHRPGDVGPFSLMNYKQAVAHGSQIKDYTQSRRMPPWKAVGGPAYQHDRTMPDKEIETLAAWVDAGMPEGDPKHAPEPRKFTTGWALGKPDLILKMQKVFVLGPNGPDHFQCVVLPTGLTEDMFVVAYEVRPGNARIVHHVVSYFDASGTARIMERDALAKQMKGGLDVGPGYPSPMGIGFKPKNPADVGSLGGWTPGMRGVAMAEGTGMYLPRNSDVVLQMHYHRTGKQETDQTEIGLYFAKNQRGVKPLEPIVIPGKFVSSRNFEPFETIPAGDDAYRAVGKVAIDQNCHVYGVLPHMHMLGTSIKITMKQPGQKEEILVNIPEWDYNWQEVYSFKEPIAVKAGTIFTVEGTYDNSAKNLHNPSTPPIDVKRGDQTTDEMLFGFLRATVDKPGSLKVRVLEEKKEYQK